MAAQGCSLFLLDHRELLPSSGANTVGTYRPHAVACIPAAPDAYLDARLPRSVWLGLRCIKLHMSALLIDAQPLTEAGAACMQHSASLGSNAEAPWLEWSQG